MKIDHLVEEARIRAAASAEFAAGLRRPALRLGITGLSRSGKTVFITALVHALLNGGRLPLFAALQDGRINRCTLVPQPDLGVPRFAYEAHLAALTGPNRAWPQSTTSVSQLRIAIDYTPTRRLARWPGRALLYLDIVDYPGEWLLDLPLLAQDYRTWSGATLAAATRPPRSELARDWLEQIGTLDPTAPASEPDAIAAAAKFTDYLHACREARVALSTLPPGRFLMPGDLKGSPALTFAPINLPKTGKSPPGSNWQMMQDRFEAYKTHIVRPFFRDHFSRLDRQVVLVDALAALNVGPSAVADQEQGLTQILKCFRHGRGSMLARMFRPRIDRILVAATKADHLHHTGHGQLQAIVARLTQSAGARAKLSGAVVEALALASVRATKEAQVAHDGEELKCITGIPQAGQQIGDETFDGQRRAAIFPGDLPATSDEALEPGASATPRQFVRFRPP
ncbi:MAG: YcjX family protein, partial [Alphaproteobacteria bacterium]